MNTTVLNTCLSPSLLFIVGLSVWFRESLYLHLLSFSQRINSRSRGCLQLAVPNMWLVQKSGKGEKGSWNCEERKSKRNWLDPILGACLSSRIQLKESVRLQPLAKTLFEMDSAEIRKISFLQWEWDGVYQPHSMGSPMLRSSWWKQTRLHIFLCFYVCSLFFRRQT